MPGNPYTYTYLIPIFVVVMISPTSQANVKKKNGDSSHEWIDWISELKAFAHGCVATYAICIAAFKGQYDEEP